MHALMCHDAGQLRVGQGTEVLRVDPDMAGDVDTCGPDRSLADPDVRDGRAKEHMSPDQVTEEAHRALCLRPLRHGIVETHSSLPPVAYDRVVSDSGSARAAHALKCFANAG